MENSSKCWICDKDYVNNNDLKVRDYCHITGKYRGSAHRDCNINLKWNHIFPVILHNLQNYDSHLNEQGLGKFNLTINVILNGLEKQMNFITNNKLKVLLIVFNF